MKPGNGVKNLFLMLPTAGLFIVFALVAIFSRSFQLRTEEASTRAARIDLVEQMRLSLLTASDAERSAVLAVTDADSESFAKQAQLAIFEEQRLHDELARLLAGNDPAHAQEALLRFAKAFEEFRKLDTDILALAVQNTNLKAYGLAFGPAAEEVSQLDAALSHLMNGDPQARDSAARALLGVLRIQALLAPHIAEQSDDKMDAMEALMSKEDKEVRQHLGELQALPMLRDNADLGVAVASYSGYEELRSRILKLSRQNTNVHSLSLTLDRNRSSAMSACEDALSALRLAVMQEDPVPRAPVSPR